MAHRSRLAGFIIDCQDTDAGTAARFWSAALGLVPRAAETDTDGAQYEADDIDAEADRLEALGARRIGFVKRWWVMEAPTGHRFCVVRMKHPDNGQPATTWA